MCAHVLEHTICHGTHVEVREQLHGTSSFLPLLCVGSRALAQVIGLEQPSPSSPGYLSSPREYISISYRITNVIVIMKKTLYASAMLLEPLMSYTHITSYGKIYSKVAWYHWDSSVTGFSAVSFSDGLLLPF